MSAPSTPVKRSRTICLSSPSTTSAPKRCKPSPVKPTPQHGKFGKWVERQLEDWFKKKSKNVWQYIWRCESLLKTFEGYKFLNTNLHDFISPNGKSYLSVKTTCNSSVRIAPQIIGQKSQKGLQEYFKTSIPIKKWIAKNPKLFCQQMLNNTFHCHLIVFARNWAKNTNALLNIKLIKPIDLNCLDVRATTSTITFRKLIYGQLRPIASIQFHSNRPQCPFRWNLRNLLAAYPSHFKLSGMIMDAYNSTTNITAFTTIRVKK